MKLRCFRIGAVIGLVCGEGSPDFCLEQLMVSCAFENIKIGRKIG